MSIITSMNCSACRRGIVAFIAIFGISDGAEATCPARPLNQSEAMEALSYLPQSVAASRSGSRLELFPWQPGPSVRRDIFWLFLVTQYPGGGTLDNGVLGYFGVNRWTAEVLDLNSHRVEGPNLQAYQRRVTRSHCLNGFIPDRSVDLGGDRLRPD